MPHRELADRATGESLVAAVIAKSARTRTKKLVCGAMLRSCARSPKEIIAYGYDIAACSEMMCFVHITEEAWVRL